jgi:mono/diheme cytochrome c family protein
MTGDCVFPDVQFDLGGPAVAVAFDAKTDTVVAQTREPASLRLFDRVTFEPAEIPLGGVNVLATGHEIFHRSTGGGIACASCHPEGTDDGHVWSFSDFGLRRTQPLDVQLAGTTPFHWGGDIPDFGALVGDVLVTRMGGHPQSVDRVAALESYLYQLRPRPGIRAASDAAALRGKELFESERVGCAECHTGRAFTSPDTQNIGKDVATQVPSLLGISTRPPFMHDGCASTLRDRFDPACGGDRHGTLQDVTTAEIDDLIAYLETL